MVFLPERRTTMNAIDTVNTASDITTSVDVNIFAGIHKAIKAAALPGEADRGSAENQSGGLRTLPDMGA
jgi:hypothetical protein